MEEKDFRNWLINFIEESQINQNNTFSYRNKDGSSRKNISRTNFRLC